MNIFQIKALILAMYVFFGTHHFEPVKSEITMIQDDGTVIVQSKDCNIENCLTFKSGNATSTVRSFSMNIKMIDNNEKR